LHPAVRRHDREPAFEERIRKIVRTIRSKPTSIIARPNLHVPEIHVKNRRYPPNIVPTLSRMRTAAARRFARRAAVSYEVMNISSMYA
jgi:hypothetical protein